MRLIEPDSGSLEEAVTDEKLACHTLGVDAGDVELHHVVPTASLEVREEGVTVGDLDVSVSYRLGGTHRTALTDDVSDALLCHDDHDQDDEVQHPSTVMPAVSAPARGRAVHLVRPVRFGVEVHQYSFARARLIVIILT